MFLSHILYRVKDFELAVKQLEAAWFCVDIAKDGPKPYHAIVWFTQGPYLEIIKPEDYPPTDPQMLQAQGYDLFADWVQHWLIETEGWCDFAIESKATNLDTQIEILKRHRLRFKEHEVKVEFPQGVQGWKTIVTEDRYFPFLVSAYYMDPRPYKQTAHPNGARGVEHVLLGGDLLNRKLFDELVSDPEHIRFVDGKGVQAVTLLGTSLSFEGVLRG